jgi:hypothetical protein
MANNNLFWNQMLMRSDSIVDIDPNAPDALEQVRAQLNTIAEQFDRVFDPADQFEEYVAVALCQALQRALTPKIAAPVCKVAVQKKIAPAPAKTTPQPTPAPVQKSKAAKKVANNKSAAPKSNAKK